MIATALSRDEGMPYSRVNDEDPKNVYFKSDKTRIYPLSDGMVTVVGYRSVWEEFGRQTKVETGVEGVGSGSRGYTGTSPRVGRDQMDKHFTRMGR